MAALTIRPLVWDRPRSPRPKGSTFRTSYAGTLAILEREIGHLKGSDPLLELDVTDADVTFAGTLRAGAKPRTSAARVSFNIPGQGRLEFATDAYNTWQANVHAIALALEALRAVDRYGVTSQAQQYTGFKALPGAASTPPTREQARALIKQLSGLPDDGRDLGQHYRAAAKRFHPDAGGDAEQFRQLEAARAAVGT